MHLLLLRGMRVMIMMWAFMVMAAAQFHCDPFTQYSNQEGQCCKKCGPGTSMTHLGSCEEPQCKKCGEKEYQDSYTTNPKCDRHPYCDPNKNFRVDNNKSKTKASPCMCILGFHCSSDACLTCVPHTKCKPGQEPKSKGNQTHDTVCQTCPEGTFSDTYSSDSVCQKWTECGSGYHIQQSGTAKSDNDCEKTSRKHLIAIGVSLIGIFLLAVVLGVCLCRGAAKGKVKGCVESCVGVEREPVRDETLIANPTHDPTCDVPMLTEVQFPQEDGSTMTPEENEDEPSQEMSTDVLLTDKGNFVTQENGKTEVLSRQESQTQTLPQMSSSLTLSDF